MEGLLSTSLAAGTLVLLWTLEAVIPAVPASGRQGAARLRHLLLALVNAIPAIVLAAVLGIADSAANAASFGVLRIMDVPLWIHALLALLLLDFLQYACHVLMHKTPILWRLHAVHHHAEHLEATTAFRFHTIEVAIHGVITLAAVLLLGIHVLDVVIYNAVMLPAAMFHHSNIRLHPRVESVLRWIIITPRMHRVHHSRWQPETDTNYSAVLTIWDRMFGTLSSDRRPEAVNVGLDGFGPRHTRTLKGMLATPFGDARAELGHPAEPHNLESKRHQPSPKASTPRTPTAARPATA
jgi:sterol desaturase/sphingolipid hydroxylase (fatty acid hydroxylase superfamily)